MYAARAPDPVGGVRGDQGAPDRPQGLRPDLAVAVHLGPGVDVAEVGEGEPAEPLAGGVGRAAVGALAGAVASAGSGSQSSGW